MACLAALRLTRHRDLSCLKNWAEPEPDEMRKSFLCQLYYSKLDLFDSPEPSGHVAHCAPAPPKGASPVGTPKQKVEVAPPTP